MTMTMPELLRAMVERSARVRRECLDVCTRGCKTSCDECFTARMKNEPSLLETPAVAETRQFSNRHVS
jgi:hypothetical protein